MANPTNELTIRRQMKNKDTSANKVAIVTGSATGIGYEIVDVEELRRKSSDEELFQIVGQNIAKKEEQVFPFSQNIDQVAAQEQFRMKKVVVDGERTAI